jgi:hypothetical protein
MALNAASICSPGGALPMAAVNKLCFGLAIPAFSLLVVGF